jgi:hypothetical protein
MSSHGGGGPGFATSPFGGGFDGELSPEDLFNMFFGGAGMGNMGGSFGGGPGKSSFDPMIDRADSQQSLHSFIWSWRVQDDACSDE